MMPALEPRLEARAGWDRYQTARAAQTALVFAAHAKREPRAAWERAGDPGGS